MSIVVVACGGRNFYNMKAISHHLGAVNDAHIIRILATGGANGADKQAETWASLQGIQVVSFPVSRKQWQIGGKGEGHRRNRLMLEMVRPHLVVAFPGGNGTANCVWNARSMGIEVREVK